MLTTYLLEKLRFSTLYLRWPLGNAQLHKAVKNKIGLPQKRSPGAPPSQLLSEEVTHGEGCSSYLLYPLPLSAASMILGTGLMLMTLKTFQHDASFVTMSPR